MNTCVISGFLARAGVLNGDEHKALRFTVAAKHGYDAKEEKDRVEFVPCVLFAPSEAMTTLAIKQWKGLYIEFKGRISTSRYEKEGQMVYSTQVVVDKNSINLVKVNPEPAAVL